MFQHWGMYSITHLRMPIYFDTLDSDNRDSDRAVCIVGQCVYVCLCEQTISNLSKDDISCVYRWNRLNVWTECSEFLIMLIQWCRIGQHSPPSWVLPFNKFKHILSGFFPHICTPFSNQYFTTCPALIRCVFKSIPQTVNFCCCKIKEIRRCLPSK